MDNDINTWLFDIHNSILEIESFFIEIYLVILIISKETSGRNAR